MKKTIGIILTSYSTILLACTAFGVVTSDGTIIGKNRDYFYNPQQFIKIMPHKKFASWCGNTYQHANSFYALTSQNDVKMGVNNHGLVAIEEDPPFPKGAESLQRYKAPPHGYSEGDVLRGVLQNFNTVTEIKPYISLIFSKAAPNFYQFSDNKKILTVEVAYGAYDNSKHRKFEYKILYKPSEYFSHTNTYLSKNFKKLNSLDENIAALQGAENRYITMKSLLLAATTVNIKNSQKWFLSTQSNISSTTDVNWCLNTSIFRSNLQKESAVNLARGNNKIYGSVSSLIVKNTGNPITTQVYIRMLNSITPSSNGNQLIKYQDLTISLKDLFKAHTLHYQHHSFIRKKPQHGYCK